MLAVRDPQIDFTGKLPASGSLSPGRFHLRYQVVEAGAQSVLHAGGLARYVDDAML